jgi:hypothetical protein
MNLQITQNVTDVMAATEMLAFQEELLQDGIE